MTIIHLLPEAANSTIQSLDRSQQAIEIQIQGLFSASNRLVEAWQGGRSDEALDALDGLARELRHQRDELVALIERLKAEIAEWEQVDRHGADLLRGTGSQFTWGRTGIHLPSASGGSLAWLYPVQPIQPMMAVLSVATFLQGLPAWLDSFLDRFFPPPEPIISPLPDDQTAPQAQPSAPEPEASSSAQPITPPTDAPEASPPDQPPSPAAPVYEQYYDVPELSQGNLYGSAACAPTSVSMVLDYYHTQNPDLNTATPQAIIDMLDQGDGTPGSGMSLSNVTDELNDLGYTNITARAGASMEQLEQSLADGPVIVTTGVGIVGPGSITADVPRALTGPGNVIHAMVVKGIGEDVVVVNDPWTGNELTFSTETFTQMWTNGSSGMYVIRP